ncbi:MAG: N-6 DNA methylase [Chloroflexi bacterium]|nr:N-6 DNA methylase [Chloroflexota bacterium]
MTPQEFVKKWENTVLSERQVAQAHFLDVCKLVGVDMPGGDGLTADGDIFIFEQPVKKESGRGRADVYHEGRFAVEYKTPDKYKDLDAAYRQLREYKDDLKNPPLLVVTDINHWEIHTNFVNTQNRPYIINHSEIDSKPEVLSLLRDMFHSPQSLHPRHHTERVTVKAAEAFQLIADNMRQWDAQPTQIAYFLTKLVFCMFAEDVRLLPTAAGDNPDGIFTHIVKQSLNRPSIFKQYLQHLFAAMNDGGELMMRDIRYFNGTLFIYTHAEELLPEALEALVKAADLNWKAIEPTIFGTLFERSLDPNKRSQLGAHYTSREDIELIVRPVLMDPLLYEWDTVQLEAEPLRKRYENAKSGRERNVAVTQLLQLRERILHRIRQITVLDPACGSGNFLYVALQLLMDLERDVIEHDLWAGLQRARPEVHPRQMYGIEIEPIAHALASIVVWIGYIQWRTNNAYGDTIREPILEELKGHIVCKDAILAFDEEGNPTEPEWPAVDVIVGNPPFLGGKLLRTELGDDYVNRLFQHYAGGVPAAADLVTYWFENAWKHISAGKVRRAGLLATNSIRQQTNNTVLRKICDEDGIFLAWSDRDWTLDGAAVRVSMIGFDDGSEQVRYLDGERVTSIYPNLTGDVDISIAQQIPENNGLCLRANEKGGAFDISAEEASMMLEAENSSGRSNRDVLKQWVNATDIVKRPRQKWIIDFGVDTSLNDARQYEIPFQHVEQQVKPKRLINKMERLRVYWWLHRIPGADMRATLSRIRRYLATPVTSKHRLFVWLDSQVLPENLLVVFARDDDYFFGVLHSKLHEVWSLRMGTWLGKGNDPRYTPTTTFETFPFPWSPGRENTSHPAHAAISRAAKQLHEERHAWLNPAGMSEKQLKDHTLTNLYNALQVYRGLDDMRVKPDAGNFAPRLDELHQALDKAVCDAYGWEYAVLDDEEEILRRLLALNLARAG